MKTVSVRTNRPYEVHIGKGLLDTCGALVKELFPKSRVVIVSDETVMALYGEKVCSSFREVGIEPLSFSFTPGETHKTLATIEDILAFLAKKQITRGDILLALGGGIVGDVTGFAASVYLRGIPFVQIPTTVLAAVDSSVGGKTGVNLLGLKNQVGTFWQPSLVICDPDAFSTLPAHEYAGGMAEVIKYAVIFDRELFEKLERGINIEEIITACVALKAKTVEADERDTGVRQLLNFGHTTAHAIEAVTENKVSHGHAVAMGMVIATKTALGCGICKEDFLERLKNLLLQYDLPLETTRSKEELLSAMNSDKKRSGNTITLVLPESCGHCILHQTDMETLASILTI